MKKLVFVLVFVLFSFGSFVFAISEKEMSSARVGVDISGFMEIRPEKGTVRYFDTYIFIYPKEDRYTLVLSLEFEPEFKIGEKNGKDALYNRREGLSGGRYEYSIKYKLLKQKEVYRISKKISYPYQFNDKTLEPYLEYGEKDYATTEIRKKASEILAGVDDYAQAVFRLSSWASENIDYSKLGEFDFANTLLSAEEVFRLKSGVCDEYSVLLMAMLKASGIPAKYVVGMTYSEGLKEYSLHAWVEVYVPEVGWVPVDPVFREVFWLDPTHIKLGEFSTPKSVSAEYEWVDAELIDSSMDVRAELLDSNKDENGFLDVESFFESEDIKQDSYNVLWVKVRNKNGFYLSSDIKVFAPGEIEFKSEENKYIILSPEETRVIPFVFYVPRLNENFGEGENGYIIYSFPFLVDGDFFSKEWENLTVTPKSKNEHSYLEFSYLEKQVKDGRSMENFLENFSVEFAYPQSAYENESVNISAVVRNLGNTPVEDLRVCVEGVCKSEFVGIGGSGQMNFSVLARDNISAYYVFGTERKDEIINIGIEKRPVLGWFALIWNSVLRFFSKLQKSF